MMKPLEAGKLAELQKEFPVEEAPAKLTRAQKLNHLASLVEKVQGPYLALGHLLERRNDAMLANMPAEQVGALGLAERDETFRKDGLNHTLPGEPGYASIKDVRDYLELTTGELHEFSCDCGGPITPRSMADRLRGLASRSAPQPGIIGRALGAIGF